MAVAFVLALTLLALVTLSLEAMPVDVVGIALIVAFTVSGILTPAEAMAGFSNEAVVVIAGLFVLSAALRRSGVIDALSRAFQTRVGARPRSAPFLLFGVVAAVSSLVSNTSCTALFLPAGLSLALRLRSSASRLLMPLAYASILGGTVTVVGTSTNLIVRGLLPKYGEPALGFFELAPVALPIAVCGVVYLGFARRLLPERCKLGVENRYALREYTSEIEVEKSSPLVGRTVAEIDLGRLWDLNLVAVVRDGERQPARPDATLRSGDVLVVETGAEALERVSRVRGLRLRAATAEAVGPLVGAGLAELLVLPRSDLVGRTLVESRFRQRHGVNVLALSRRGEVLHDHLADVRLRVGDVLLTQADAEASVRLLAQPGLLVLSQRPPLAGVRTAVVSSAIFLGVLALAAFGALGIASAVLLGCVLLVVTRCLTPQEAYLAVEWRLIMLVAGMLALGAAMEKTGAAEAVAAPLVAWVAGGPSWTLLVVFYLLTVALSQPMSNQAAVLLVLPIALETAATAGLNLRAMAVTVTLAASSSFLTPLEPSSLLVYGPGEYRFGDFWRLGLGLTVIAFVLTALLVPVFWPLVG